MSTILVVDDMAIFRELISTALRQKGYEALTASSGKEALSLILNQLPDLILLDVTMPEMDGLTVLKILKSNPIYRDIPVILLTAVAERESVLRATSLRPQDYVLKSHFSLDDLLHRVQNQLEKKASPTTVGASSSAGLSTAEDQRQIAPQQRRLKSAEETPDTGSARTNKTQVLEEPCAAVVPSVLVKPRKFKSPNSSQHDTQKTESLQAIISRKKLLELLGEGLELRPLAPIVQNVMAATANPHCSAEDVAKAVAQDQALCIRILRLANASVYARGRSADSIKTAVGRLGIREVRNLVTALGVMQQYEGRLANCLDAQLFWEHSIACGLLASAIACACNFKSTDDFFLWGLLHDVGRLILLEHVSDLYLQVLETAAKLDAPLEEVETKMLTLNHCDVLERALEHWRFPREFIAPVVGHHLSVHSIKQMNQSHLRQTAVISLANRLAPVLLLGNSGNEVLYTIAELQELLELEETVLVALMERIPDEVNALKLTMLARTNQSAWPSIADQLRARWPQGVQPTIIAQKSETDSLRLFLQRLAPTSERVTANCGIIHLDSSVQQQAIFEKFQEHEHSIDAAGLPVLIICDQGAIDPHCSFLEERSHVIRRLPMRMDTIMSLLKELVSIS